MVNGCVIGSLATCARPGEAAAQADSGSQQTWGTQQPKKAPPPMTAYDVATTCMSTLWPHDAHACNILLMHLAVVSCVGKGVIALQGCSIIVCVRDYSSMYSIGAGTIRGSVPKPYPASNS
jgi:hypothetical protein